MQDCAAPNGRTFCEFPDNWRCWRKVLVAYHSAQQEGNNGDEHDLPQGEACALHSYCAALALCSVLHPALLLAQGVEFLTGLSARIFQPVSLRSELDAKVDQLVIFPPQRSQVFKVARVNRCSRKR